MMLAVKDVITPPPVLLQFVHSHLASFAPSVVLSHPFSRCQCHRCCSTFSRCQLSVFSCHRCCSTHSRRCRRIHQESNQRGRIIDKSKTLDLGCLFYSSCIETVRYETTTHGRPLELRCRCWAVSASLCLSSLRRT